MFLPFFSSHARAAGLIFPFLAGMLLPVSTVSAQVGGGIPERRPDAVGFVFKPVTFSIVFETMVSKFRKAEGGSRYLQTESVAKLSSGWQVGQDGKFVPAVGAGEEHSIPFVDSSVKLIRNGETFFAKIESGYPALSEPGGIVLKFSGIYELSLLAGSWEDYEKGGIMKVTISSKDQDRYLGDLANMYRDPDFLRWHATQYKDRLLKEFEAKASPPENKRVETDRAALLASVVGVTPEFTATEDVFEVQGESLIATRKRSKLTLLYRVSLPDPVRSVP